MIDLAAVVVGETRVRNVGADWPAGTFPAMFNGVTGVVSEVREHTVVVTFDTPLYDPEFDDDWPAAEFSPSELDAILDP